jgi:beta-glucosidase
MENQTMYRIIPLILIALFFTTLTARADEFSPPHCGKGFTVTGDIKHSKKAAGITVQGADDPEAFDEEIYGTEFTARVDGLPAGKYTLQIDLAETYCKGPGQRLFNITCGKQKLAENLDLFATAGFAKAYRITAAVDHAPDAPGATGGPLAITFTAVKENAKLNAIHVLDANGKAVACMKAKNLSDMAPVSNVIPDIKEAPIYLDPAVTLDKRVDDLIRRMSIAEKINQTVNAAAGIDRLQVPPYNYWNECLHGVARAGHATVFPQAIGMAAMWDTPLMHTVGDTISTEARAKYHEAIRHDKHAIYYGLDFWTPNINIFRDPRWGRGQETYGEDPFLTSRVAVAFITGLQGDDPHYFKALACAKHYAVHSGPESTRHSANVAPPERDFYETYLPQFEAAVREAHVDSIMGAYNAVYGEPACSSKLLLEDLLRTKWGFTGYVVSDCDAVGDIHSGHHTTKTPEEAAARAIKAGCDLDCGGTYHHLAKALQRGLVTEADIDVALRRIFRARFQLGMFDPQDKVPYASIPFSENDSTAHGQISLQAARESMVLLKNTGILPLDKAKLKKIAVLGANASDTGMLMGNYNGDPSHPVNILQGIKDAIGDAVEISHTAGCPLAIQHGKSFDINNAEAKKALGLARDADLVIYVGGINPNLEGEEMSVNYDGFSGGDRTRIELPPCQTEFLKALKETGKPIIFVNCSGSAIAMPWEAENLPAIVQAWYPGQSGGTAVADVLFGNYNPAGRLPVTFYASTEDLPKFDDYSMANRTYRYFSGKPLFPFGHGLSYTEFKYADAKLAADSIRPADTIHISIAVQNTGARDGQEVVQAYVKQLAPSVPQPIHALAGFQRIAIAAGQTATVTMEIPAARLRYWDIDKKDYVVAAGKYEIQIGASSADIRASAVLTVAP